MYVYVEGIKKWQNVCNGKYSWSHSWHSSQMAHFQTHWLFFYVITYCTRNLIVTKDEMKKKAPPRFYSCHSIIPSRYAHFLRILQSSSYHMRFMKYISIARIDTQNSDIMLENGKKRVCKISHLFSSSIWLGRTLLCIFQSENIYYIYFDI